MKKTSVMLVSFGVSLIILLVTGSLAYIKGKNAGLATVPRTSPVVSVTNAPVSVQTNAVPSQVDLLAAEVRALKAANEEREAKVKRLLALNEEVRREREIATNVVTVPVTVNVTNSPPSVTINGTIHIGDSPTQQPVLTNKTTTPSKKTKSPKAQSPKTQTRVPMYTITNQTSSVTTTGSNTSSVVNTQVQSFLKPQRRWSVLGLLIGEKDPISTSVPSGQSVQQGHPEPTIVVSPSYGYPYGYGGGYGGYGYGSPYRSMYSGYGSSEKRLFGYRFRSR